MGPYLDGRLVAVETNLKHVVEKMEEIHALVLGMDHSIRGNGKVGLNQRVDRLEQAAGARGKVWVALISGITALVVALLAG